VYTTFHYPVTGANVVTTENSDWATNCPEYKVTAVQVALAHPMLHQGAESAVERVLAAGLAE
jgi:formate dehydrogenase major subunit